MEQLTQKLKDGNLTITEVPIPQIGYGEILVQNLYSCISAGTESSTIKAARKSIIGKAKDRPQQFVQVLESLRTQGPVQTYRKVMKKLDAHSSLGYSSVGKVLSIGECINEFKPGDIVACGGGSACHAEFVSVPRNLCVKVMQGIPIQQAAYTTIGAIAMQGIRQADLHIGETCCVIGLGLLGQLTCNMLKASGIRVVGVDLDPNAVECAREHCTNDAFIRNDPGIENFIIDFCDGMGCDSIIITAGSSSLDPINFAGAIARQKANIVVVGAVPTGFERDPYFYKKELSVRMSCSYGPGRYDPNYEEKGLDYPYGYVRWTERRNMQAFLTLIADKKINIEYMTSHIFKLEDAPKAYDIVLNRTEPHLGMLIEYDSADIENMYQERRLSIQSPKRICEEKVKIGFIGAGSYAQGSLLPNIPINDNIKLKGVMTKTSTSSRSAADRFKFEFCTSDSNDIIKSEDINTVFIVTQHDTHGRYVIEALKNGKNVFVEKPLCFKIEDLQEINDLVVRQQKDEQKNILMVGYNRRYSSLSHQLKSLLRSSPMAAIYTINAGSVPSDSWIQDPEKGGGRIHGEVCHFIDYLTFITDSLPVSVYACTMKSPTNLEDTVSIVIHYENGSIGTINYFANGGKGVPKERIEIFQAGTTFHLNDFKELIIFGGRKPVITKLFQQDKGYKNEITLFIDAVFNGKPSPIPYPQIYSTTITTFGVVESLKTGASVSITY